MTDISRFQLYRDGKRVLECLQRALRVADACMDAAVSIELFVEILNQYVYYFDQENEAVSFQPTTSPLIHNLHFLPSLFAILPYLLPTIVPATNPMTGNDKIHQRPHRAHPLQRCNIGSDACAGEPEEAFHADA